MNKVMTAALLLVFVGSLAGCGVSQETTQQETTLKIGVLAPLTGGVAVFGERMERAMSMATEDVKERYPEINLDLRFEDACDAKSSLNATRKLLDIDHVDVIGGSFCLFGLDAVRAILDKEKVITFNTAASPDEMLNQSYLFTTNVAIKDDAEKIVDFLDAKDKTVSFIGLNTIFGKSYERHLKTNIEQAGGILAVSEFVEPFGKDFRTELTRIKASNPDTIVAIHFSTALGTIIKQARELSMDATIIGDYESEDSTIVEVAGAAAEGYLFSSSDPAEENSTVRSFEKQYQNKYGEKPDVIATNAYDTIQILADAFVECGSKDADCLAAALRSVEEYSGASGLFSMGKDGAAKKDTLFKTVKDGTFVVLKH